MAKEEEQKWQDLLAARAKMTAPPVVLASDPLAQGYRVVPLDDTEVETHVVQSPGVQKPSTDPSTWGIVDMTTVKPQETKTAPAYELPPRPEKPVGYGDYGWFDEFSNDYFEPPLTPEERARRERVAYISSGVANLGNAIGALGNMFYARGGAPAQKLPTMPDVDQKVDAFRQRADKVRDDYLRSRMAVQKAQDDLYDKEDARWLRLKQANDLSEYREASNEIRRMRAETERELQDAKNKYWEAKAHGEEERANWYAAQAYAKSQLLGFQIDSQIALAASRYASANSANALADQRRGTKTVTDNYGKVVTTSYSPSSNSTSNSNTGGNQSKGTSTPTKPKGENTRKLGL